MYVKFLCDDCRWDWRSCKHRDRPNALRCPDYESKSRTTVGDRPPTDSLSNADKEDKHGRIWRGDKYWDSQRGWVKPGEKKSAALYVALGLLTLGAYFSVKDFMAWPVRRDIIVSNMTVSYVLALGLIGWLSPRITRAVWPSAPKWGFIVIAVVLALAVVYILKLLGAPTRI